MDSQQIDAFVVFGIGSLGLLILLMAAIFSKSGGKQLGWGVVATSLLLFQFVYSEQHSFLHLPESGKRNSLYWFEIISLFLTVAYFLFAAVRVINGQRAKCNLAPNASLPSNANKLQPSKTRQVPLWLPISILFGIAVAVISAAFLNGVTALLFLPLFPTGLSALASPLSSIQNKPLVTSLAILLLVLPYVLYLTLFVAILRARTWNRFGIICFVLACALLLNVAGCSRMLEGFSNIN